MARTVVANNCSVASSLGWMLNDSLWHSAFSGDGAIVEAEADEAELEEAEIDEADYACLGFSQELASEALASAQDYPSDGLLACFADDWTTVFSRGQQFGSNGLFDDVVCEGY